MPTAWAAYHLGGTVDWRFISVCAGIGVSQRFQPLANDGVYHTDPGSIGARDGYSIGDAIHIHTRPVQQYPLLGAVLGTVALQLAVIYLLV